MSMLQATPKLEDFPALGGLAVADKPGSAIAGPSSSQPSPARPSTSGPPADGAAAATGVSDALKAANKATLLSYDVHCVLLLLTHVQHQAH